MGIKFGTKNNNFLILFLVKKKSAIFFSNWLIQEFLFFYFLF
jgi:hypothetical protein